MEDETNLTKEKNIEGIYIRVSTDDQDMEHRPEYQFFQVII